MTKIFKKKLDERHIIRRRSDGKLFDINISEPTHQVFEASQSGLDFYKKKNGEVWTWRTTSELEFVFTAAHREV